MENKPDIYIRKEILDRLQALADACPEEIGGLLIVEPREGKLTITDFLLPIQEVSGASVDIKSADLMRLVAEKTRETGNRDLDTKIRGCWHSHVNMSVNHSGIDAAMLREWLGDGNVPYVVELLLNKKREYGCHLEITTPITARIECELYLADDTVYVEWAKAEIEAKIKKPVSTPTTLSQYYNPYNYGTGYWTRREEPEHLKGLHVGDKDEKYEILTIFPDTGLVTARNLKTLSTEYFYKNPFNPLAPNDKPRRDKDGNEVKNEIQNAIVTNVNAFVAGVDLSD